MNRLTVERVGAAYEKTGWEPISGVYLKGYKHGCPIAAVVKAETDHVVSTDTFGHRCLQAAAEFLNLDEGYLSWFRKAYDNHPREGLAEGAGHPGVADGEAARREYPPVIEFGEQVVH